MKNLDGWVDALSLRRSPQKKRETGKETTYNLLNRREFSIP
jgi:hypothetical protein